MDKEWRPKDWEKIREEYGATDIPDSTGTYEDDYTAGFECGADAMLEGLFKLASDSPTKTFIIDSRVYNIFGGIDEPENNT